MFPRTDLRARPQNLTRGDIEALLSNPSGETRSLTAAKIASDFSKNVLSAAERQLAEDIFRIMVKDAEVRVREALSDNLKSNPDIPHDVALAMAYDVDTVSLPVLQFSEVLSDEDLIEIIANQSEPKQTAIAKRQDVSVAVTTALIDTENDKVVTTLVGNDTAEISEQSFQKVVDTLGDNESIQQALVNRPKLPVTIAERLMTVVADNMKEELVKRHDLSEDMITDILMQSRERATIALSSESSQEELSKLVHQLKDQGRLTSSIVIRALCMGDVNFFETALAELAGVPQENSRQLIHDSGDLGLKAIYLKAGLPLNHLPAVRGVLSVISETQYDGGENDLERFSRRMIERVLTQYDDLGVELDADDLEYLLNKMSKLPHDRIDDAA